MIVDRIRAEWVAAAERERPSANPTGSRWGSCTAQLEQLAFPDLTKPEVPQPRRQAVFEVGHVLAEWLARKIHRAYPGMWGLREATFYLPVPVADRAALDLIRTRLRPHAPTEGHPAECCWTRTMFYGWPIDDFTPPKLELLGRDPEGRPRLRIRGISPGPYQPSVILDAARGFVYLVTYVDGFILHDEYGLTLVEQKTCSNATFRRALVGDVEYRYQCQLVGTLKATGATSALWLMQRKETQHILELGFVRELDGGSRITLTAPSGIAETYRVAGTTALARLDGGAPAEFPADDEWEVASLWTPYQAMEPVIADIHRRVLRVLTADPARGWTREYGPDFRCQRCAGQGRLTCAHCRGTGISLKSGKACGACGAKGKNTIGVLGQVRCSGARGGCAGRGILDQVTLGWECSYCPVAVSSCLASAGVTRIIEKRRPRLLVTRAGWQASGLTFEPPTPVELQPTPDTGEEEEDEA